MNDLRFGRCLFLAALLAGIRTASADDEIPLKLHNDTSQAIDVFIASERSPAEKPWTHLQIGADEDGQCELNSPERYIIVVEAGEHRWRSKPIGLKEFVSAHSGYLVRISELQTNSIGAQVEPGPDAQMAPPDAGDSAPPAPQQTLPLKFRKYELANQAVWSLAPHRHTLKLHNDMSEAVDIYIAPQNSQESNPWTHLKIEPRADATAELKAADPFIIRMEVGGGSGRSRPVYLQEYLDDHPDYVMAVGRTYKGVVTGTPYSPGSAEGVSPGTRSRGPVGGKPTAPLPPVSVGPDDQKPNESKTELAPALMIEWDAGGR